MARRAHGGTYEFVGIRDRGDAIIGPHDKIILKDSEGRRHEFYLGDDQALAYLHTLGVRPEEINGLSLGEVQERLDRLYHKKKEEVSKAVTTQRE